MSVLYAQVKWTIAIFALTQLFAFNAMKHNNIHWCKTKLFNAPMIAVSTTVSQPCHNKECTFASYAMSRMQIAYNVAIKTYVLSAINQSILYSKVIIYIIKI